MTLATSIHQKEGPTPFAWPRDFPIVQFPNAALLAAFAGGQAAAVTHGAGHADSAAVSHAAMTIWAYEELLHGVNWFRHLLGLVYIISTVAHLALALGHRMTPRSAPRSPDGSTLTTEHRPNEGLGAATTPQAQEQEPHRRRNPATQGHRNSSRQRSRSPLRPTVEARRTDTGQRWWPTTTASRRSASSFGARDDVGDLRHLLAHTLLELAGGLMRARGTRRRPPEW
jgi:hypothetical protein